MRGRRTKLDFRTVDGRNKRRRRGGGAGSAHARRRGQEGDSGNRSPSTRWSVSFYGVEGCRSDNEKARKASVRMVNTMEKSDNIIWYSDRQKSVHQVW